ncbi:hypothetical protein EYF80_038759 [Liparis tanakae]|uniref:Uncharacterized protein n=1 Tax=Liparis tanakae TaxID=230148 RepID=A0A4Z2GCC7_9TELE|nr:hypothetical protein EYF80_038759 [Liparis tanakae]
MQTGTGKQEVGPERFESIRRRKRRKEEEEKEEEQEEKEEKEEETQLGESQKDGATWSVAGHVFCVRINTPIIPPGVIASASRRPPRPPRPPRPVIGRRLPRKRFFLFMKRVLVSLHRSSGDNGGVDNTPEVPAPRPRARGRVAGGTGRPLPGLRVVRDQKHSYVTPPVCRPLHRREYI